MMTHHTRLMRAHVRYAAISGLSFGASLGVFSLAVTVVHLTAVASLVWLGIMSAALSFVAYDEARNTGPDFDAFTRRKATDIREPHA